jgi:hypothetical protein
LRAAVVVCILVTAACGSFGAASEPSPDAGPSEGGSPDAGGGSLDGSAIDSAVDAKLDAAAEGCGWPIFADTFERTDLLGSWSALQPNYGTGLDVTLGAAPSPRGPSLQVSIQPAMGPRTRTLSRPLGTPPTPTPTCIELELSVYVQDFGGGQYASFASIQLADETAISLWNDDGAIVVVEQTSDGILFENAAYTSAPKNAWHRVVVRYTYVPEPSLTLYVDGAKSDITKRNIMKGAPTELRVGGGFTKSETTALFWIDDVKIR